MSRAAHVTTGKSAVVEDRSMVEKIEALSNACRTFDRVCEHLDPGLVVFPEHERRAARLVCAAAADLLGVPHLTDDGFGRLLAEPTFQHSLIDRWTSRNGWSCEMNFDSKAPTHSPPVAGPSASAVQSDDSILTVDAKALREAVLNGKPLPELTMTLEQALDQVHRSVSQMTRRPIRELQRAIQREKAVAERLAALTEGRPPVQDDDHGLLVVVKLWDIEIHTHIRGLTGGPTEPRRVVCAIPSAADRRWIRDAMLNDTDVTMEGAVNCRGRVTAIDLDARTFTVSVAG